MPPSLIQQINPSAQVVRVNPRETNHPSKELRVYKANAQGEESADASIRNHIPSVLWYDYGDEGKRFIETRPLNSSQKPKEVQTNANRLDHH